MSDDELGFDQALASAQDGMLIGDMSKMIKIPPSGHRFKGNKILERNSGQ